MLVDMIYYGCVVRRGVLNIFVVVDMLIGVVGIFMI